MTVDLTTGRMVVRGYRGGDISRDAGARPLWSTTQRGWVCLAEHAADIVAVAEHQRRRIVYREINGGGTA